MSEAVDSKEVKASNFVRGIIDADLASGKHDHVHTRFPPEPNGYLHIGHAKSICLNFGLARDYQGTCNLRFDDTNPAKEDVEFVESIQRDIKWLGFDWGENLYHASDYFQQIYDVAVELIQKGLAYVCELSEDEIREYRGTVKEPGKPSPYRDRPAEESLALLEQMRKGEIEEGKAVLRAKIDMSAANMKMRDPLLYRVRHVPHDRTGDAWCIYPMYDFAHPLSDAFEKITHSICTLEFENNRDIYDWLVDNATVPAQPRQYEFARLNLNYTVMSKRKLLELVEGNYVNGWDDPRMPTVAGMRRRGYTPESIRDFCERIGVAKANSTVDFGMLEFCVRDDLNTKAPRVMAVLDPLKVVITNYPEGKVEELDAPSYPHDVPKEGSRMVPFEREVYIERADFMEDPPKKFFRLSPGKEVRLRYGYVVKCDEVIKDNEGNIVELRCSYDPETLGQNPKDRKISGTIHWVPAKAALPCDVRMYDRLFLDENPGAGDVDFKDQMNPDSLKTVKALVEPSVANDAVGSPYQFERQGYFCMDQDSKEGALVFNRTVGLRDSWAKATTKEMPKPAAKKAPKAAPKPQVARELSPEVDSLASLYVETHGLSRAEAETLADNDGVSKLFEAAVKVDGASAKTLSTLITGELMRVLKEKELGALPFGATEMGELAALVDGGTISKAIAKDVFGEMAKNGGRPGDIVEEKGLKQVTDSSELEGLLDAVLEKNTSEVERFRAGEKKLMGFFVGQVMKASRGKANPKLVNELLRKKL